MVSRLHEMLRYVLITLSIALIPAWPDLMGHAPALAVACDSVEAVACNAHYLLLVGMFVGGLSLIAAPRPVSQRPALAALRAGVAGTCCLAAFALGGAAIAAVCTVVTGVLVIYLYASTFYLLAETADFKTISYISACSLALKAVILPALGLSLPEVPSAWAICLTPAASGTLAFLYVILCQKAHVERTRAEASPMKSYGRRTSAFMALLICVSSVVFAVARAGSNLQFWGSQNTIEPVSVVAALACTAIFLVICYATFTCAPGDLMLRFMPCLFVQLIAYGLLWCGTLPELGVTGHVGQALFTSYTELYSHMYFFMVMFVGLSMLGTSGVRVHGAQWAVFSAALFAVLALGQTELSAGRFFVVLALDAVLAVIFLIAHHVYGQEQVEAIKCAAEGVGHGAGEARPPATDAQAPTLAQAIEQVAFRYRLSERERAVLGLLVQGRSRAFIGEQLCLASGTVGTYVSRIYEKTRVHSKQELLTLVYDEVAGEE